MEADLTAWLLAEPTLKAVMGANLSWRRRPQGGGTPWLVLHVISRPREYPLAGDHFGLIETRLQADCWGRDGDGTDGYLQAKQLADALIAATSGRAFSQGATEFSAIFVDAERDGTFEVGAAGEELSRRMVDLIVWHKPL